MKQTIKNLFRRTPLYPPLRILLRRRQEAKQVARWERRGRTAPPPHCVKQKVLKQLTREHGLTVLVETGTYYGEMIDALENDFKRIYSIELSPELHERAKRRFRRKPHIELLQGDSAIVIAALIESLDTPALFWLDAHYSCGHTARGENDTPIYAELDHILGGQDLGHVIVIDDARLFGTDPAYPTLDELRDFIRSRRTNVEIAVEDDSIRVVPSHAPGLSVV